MTETSAAETSAAGTAAGDDHQYDLAHEWQTPQVAPPVPSPPPVRQVVPQSGRGGDYGYDLAHDLPG